MKGRILGGVEWLFRLGLAAIFVYAAVPKLVDPAGFAKAIANYRVILPGVGQDYVYLTAAFLPALEVVTALALLAGRTKWAASLLSTVMLVVFTALILSAVMRGLNIDCGCFGFSEIAVSKAQRVGWTKIAMNLGMLVMAVFVYVRSAPPKPRYKL